MAKPHVGSMHWAGSLLVAITRVRRSTTDATTKAPSSRSRKRPVTVVFCAVSLLCALYWGMEVFTRNNLRSRQGSARGTTKNIFESKKRVAGRWIES